MSKHCLFFAFLFLFSLSAQAQFRYTFKDTTTPYSALTGATSLSGTDIWDDEDYSAPMPFAWKMDSTITLNSFELSLLFRSLVDQTSDYTDMNGFSLCDANIADRGFLGATTSLSPIRYTTTGTAPNRIFKLEISNGGFLDEFYYYATMDDYFNLQIWIYETKNIVEYHYGPSKITNPSDYFFINGAGPLVGYLKHADLLSETAGSLYFLKGNPAAPALDTVRVANGPSVALNSWPANGKVYRFTPKATTCTAPVAAFTAGTASGKTVQYTYSGTATGIDSLVWDFGDGKKQKVTTGFTTPLPHTFTTNGKYNVCVTAYSRCGSHNSCRQTPLAIGDYHMLEGVQVYPNPANNIITVEGMASGDNLSLTSLIGQQVLNTVISSSSKQTLDISSLPAGAYILRLSRPSGEASSVRLVKQ